VTLPAVGDGSWQLVRIEGCMLDSSKNQSGKRNIVGFKMDSSDPRDDDKLLKTHHLIELWSMDEAP
jgi:hypothetical protein